MAVFLRNGTEVSSNSGQNKVLRILYGHKTGRAFLKVLTLPVISRLGGILLSSSISKLIIKPFIKMNNIDMSDYINQEYTSYNDFFTRDIKNGKRNFENNEYILGTPCDSKVSYYKIDDKTQILVKNTRYSLDDLLLAPSLSDEFYCGTCLVFRLSVDDYHHYHFFDDGFAEEPRVINGVLHTVNPIANDYYPIYKRNTRSYTLLHTKHFDDVIFMEVGALMVGKIVNHKITTFRKGEEKGYFEFGGSTVICLFKKGVIDIDQDIKNHSENHDEVKVKLGERVGRRIL